MSEVSTDWTEVVEQRFGSKASNGRKLLWRKWCSGHSVDDIVSGIVTIRAPFGVWIDLPPGVPALMQWPNVRGAPPRAFDQEDVLPVGNRVRARVVGVSDEEQAIRLAQVECVLHRLPSQEQARLTALVDACSSIDAVVETLGIPTHDMDEGPFIAGPGEGTWHRTVEYSSLSDHAVVQVAELSGDTLQIRFWPKLLEYRELVEKSDDG